MKKIIFLYLTSSFILFFFCGFISGFIPNASALSCATTTVHEHADFNDLVVRGTVISEDIESTSKFVDFNVKEWYKGTSADTITVRTDTTWGPYLYKGYEYIVFLTEQDKYFDLPVCTPVYFALPSIIEGMKTINDPLSSFANLQQYEVEEKLPDAERNELIIISQEIQNLISGIPLSPAKQITKGIPINEIQCKQSLVLIFKESDKSPACVKITTKQKLIQRGWAIDDNIGGTSSRSCYLTPDPGLCKAAFAKYYFDPDTNTCKAFIWGGCEGTVPFDTLELCQSLCS